jgi:hypothetical protein
MKYLSTTVAALFFATFALIPRGLAANLNREATGQAAANIDQRFAAEIPEPDAAILLAQEDMGDSGDNDDAADDGDQDNDSDSAASDDAPDDPEPDSIDDGETVQDNGDAGDTTVDGANTFDQNADDGSGE